MLERKRVDNEKDQTKMVVLSFQQFPNLDKNIDVRVASIQCNLAMSFYMGLLEFITPAARAVEVPVLEISEVGTSMPTDGQFSTSSGNFFCN